MRIKLSLLLMLCMALPSLAATGLKGILVDARSGKAIADATVLLNDQAIMATSGSDGSFTIANARAGKDQLQVIAYGYTDYKMIVDLVSGKVKNLGEIKLTPDAALNASFDSKDLFQDEADMLDDEGNGQVVGSIQGATDDIYYQATNYDFSVMRFRWRGYEQNWNTGYINGFNFNDAMRGRFNFSGLGGMTSTAFRSRSTDIGLEAATYGYGSLGGSSNFTTYASEYAPGTKGSVAFTNSNYKMRAMMQYSTGLSSNGWAFSTSVIGRYSDQGVVEGTFYNSLGLQMSLQKVLNDQHSLNISAWAAPTQRASNAAATQEAYDLAGSNLYNPSWGFLNGEKKSSRIVESADPSVTFNWIYTPTMKTKVNTGVAFRKNFYSSSALNWYQAADPRPDYYRNLPSYYKPTAAEGTDLYNAQLEAYNAVAAWWGGDQANRQIDWAGIYLANQLNRTQFDRNPELVGQASYILENRHSNQTAYMFSSTLDHRFNDFFTLQGGVNFNYTDAHYYKTVRDLLGADFWRDIDNFSERDFAGDPNILQNDMNNPDRRVGKGDVFGYDYNIRNVLATAWIQNQHQTTHWSVNYGLELSYTNFMRHGNMKNGRAPENSFGNGQSHNFENASFKTGATYKLNGRNYFTAHASVGTRAPLADYSYVSPRTKDTAITGLKSERFVSGDLSYTWNYSRFRGSVTGYFTEMWDGVKRNGFFDYQLNTFMNYTMSGIQTEYKGVELGLEYKILNNLSVSAAGTFARYTYENNPLGYRSYENGSADDVERQVFIKGYKIGGTPQQCYSLGLNYNVNSWFLELNGQYFADNWIELSPSRHEEMPGLWKFCFSPEQYEARMKEITYQDKLNNAFVMNLSIGKNIYTKFGSVNFNLSVNNLLNNTNIQTGGYQEGKFDYTDYNVNKFPNKIYYAQGIRVFLNAGIRF